MRRTHDEAEVRAGTGRRGWTLVGLLGLAALLQPGGCDKSGPPTTDDPASRLDAVLADVWPQVLEPALGRAQDRAQALVEAAEAWADAERADGDVDAARQAAQDAWFELMDVWQELEVMQVGPAGSTAASVIGGEDLRDAIYSWPTLNRCRVDQETVEAQWDAPDFFETHLVNTYGLDALENVLFATPGENACPPQVDINKEGTWAALGVDGAQQNRADFAVALAGGVLDTLETLEARWTGGFAETLAKASDPYEGAQQALNALFHALFYLETRTKDRKLGGPLGRWDCGLPSCLGEVETQLAGGSNLWIASNLRGFDALFHGGDGSGMDDLLRDLGQGALADDVAARVDVALEAAAALERPIDEAVLEEDPAATALYDAIKGVTDLLKGDVATVLALQIPSEAAGDND